MIISSYYIFIEGGSDYFYYTFTLTGSYLRIPKIQGRCVPPFFSHGQKHTYPYGGVLLLDTYIPPTI